MLRLGIIQPDGSVKSAELLEWARWFEASDNPPRSFRDGGRVIERTELPGGIEVSTVFIGINLSPFRPGAPAWFETMIFGGEHDSYQDRYSTFEEAETGHAEAVRVARGETVPD